MSQPWERLLGKTLRSAQRMPEDANLKEVLAQLEGVLAQMSEPEQLQWIGEALLQVAEICERRAEVWLTQWEEAYRDPIVAPGFFEDLVRQTMTVDLSELMEPAPPRKPRSKAAKPTEQAEGTIAAPVEKAAVLALVEQWEQEADMQSQQVFAIAHDEDVSGWIAEIDRRLQAASPRPVLFSELCYQLAMPWVEVWLGLLLGGFELQPVGEFYGQTLWVKRGADT